MMKVDVKAYEWDIYVSGLYFGTGWFSTNDEDEVLKEVNTEFDKVPYSLTLGEIHVEKSE